MLACECNKDLFTTCLHISSQVCRSACSAAALHSESPLTRSFISVTCQSELVSCQVFGIKQAWMAVKWQTMQLSRWQQMEDNICVYRVSNTSKWVRILKIKNTQTKLILPSILSSSHTVSAAEGQCKLYRGVVLNCWIQRDLTFGGLLWNCLICFACLDCTSAGG